MDAVESTDHIGCARGGAGQRDPGPRGLPGAAALPDDAAGADPPLLLRPRGALPPTLHQSLHQACRAMHGPLHRCFCDLMGARNRLLASHTDLPPPRTLPPEERKGLP